MSKETIGGAKRLTSVEKLPKRITVDGMLVLNPTPEQAEQAGYRLMSAQEISTKRQQETLLRQQAEQSMQQAEQERTTALQAAQSAYAEARSHLASLAGGGVDGAAALAALLEPSGRSQPELAAAVLRQYLLGVELERLGGVLGGGNVIGGRQ